MRDRSQLVLPMDLGIKIEENDPVRKLVEICEELDYSKLYEKYVRKWRKVSPQTLFELELLQAPHAWRIVLEMYV